MRYGISDYANGRVPPISKKRAEFVRRVSTEAMREFNRLDTIAASSNNGAPTTRSRDMVKIDFKQATELLAMFGGEPCEIALVQGDGHSGEGLYAVYADDPEGSFYLGSTDDDARPEVVEQPQAFPMQPVIVSNGIHRFKENRIVSKLVDHGNATGYGLNQIAQDWDLYTPEERMQLAQLIGYSVDGYGTLSYVSEESYAQAEAMSKELAK